MRNLVNGLAGKPLRTTKNVGGKAIDVSKPAAHKAIDVSGDVRGKAIDVTNSTARRPGARCREPAGLVPG